MRLDVVEGEAEVELSKGGLGVIGSYNGGLVLGLLLMFIIMFISYLINV